MFGQWVHSPGSQWYSGDCTSMAVMLSSNESTLGLSCVKLSMVIDSSYCRSLGVLPFILFLLNYASWRSWSWMILWRPTRTSRITTKKRCPFHHRGWESNCRKSRDTWSNRQVCPWSKKWSRAKATRVLPREHTGHSKHPLPTTQVGKITRPFRYDLN